MVDLVADMEARGLWHDSTDGAALSARLAEGSMTLYYGCDPSADSLHIGNLIGLLVLRRFNDAGHRAIALVGGATGMVGDPSGRSDEREMLDEVALASNVTGIREQVERLSGAEVVNNYDWTAPVTLLEFLRDVGKHATVNQMVAKESVRTRMESESGISYTEFSYMLLQAADYLHLARHEECELQIGGSDQWGNITAGIDLIRRRLGRAVHGFTWPLITRADGAKFGKTAEGTVWLSPERTSPYQFFQYWMRVPDHDVERFLLQLTLLEVAEARQIAADHLLAPERRDGQRRLADEITTLVHGAAAAVAAHEASAILFGGDPASASEEALAAVAGEVQVEPLPAEGAQLSALLLRTGLAASTSDARRQLDAGAVSVNGEVAGDDRVVGAGDLRHRRYVLLRRGKKSYAMLEAENPGM